MSENVMSAPKVASSQDAATAAKQKLASAFFKKGLTVAILSGMCYGLYSAFVTVAMGKGVWADWYGANTAGLSAFTVIYLLGALGAAINDTMSAVWAWIMAAIKGKTGDFFRCINSKPGRIMIAAAIIGGPIAGTCYIIALQMAGSIIIPITALCPAIGAILGRIIFKQELNKRMMAGVVICVSASVLIGSAAMGGDTGANVALGMFFAFIAALGWGIEGVIAGYGTSLIDYEIGIMIRQTVSGLLNLLILVPLMALMAGDISLAPRLTMQALTSGPAMMFFVVSGFFALFAFSLWYKGNSMCGAALGMACNGAYSFWGPFFCWIIIGLAMGQPGWALPPIVWLGALVMVFGILMIAMNPLDLFKKKEA